MKVRNRCLFCLCLLPVCLYGQDTTYYNLNNKRVKSIKLASYYAVLYPDSTDTRKKILNCYFLSGKLKSSTPFQNYNQKTRNGDIDGKFRQWYENGQLMKEIDCKVGEKDGRKQSYWRNGKLRRQEDYAANKFIRGKCFNRDGIETDYSPCDTMPAFPGGKNALIAFISGKLQYPELPRSMGVQGTSYIRFLVGKDGLITNISIQRTSGCDELDNEAIRVVKALPNWKPGILDEEVVSVYYTLPVIFKLNNQPAKSKK